MLPVTSFITGATVYRLFDDGLANFLGLETLRHGTNPVNYISIRIFGGDPTCGGNSSGSTHCAAAYTGMNDPNLANHFYLFKDTEMYKVRGFESPIKNIIYPTAKRVLPVIHSALSSYSFVTRNFSSNDDMIVKIVGTIIGVFVGLVAGAFTPTLHFRFNEIDHSRLKNDREYSGIAYKTSQKVEAWRIGLIGTLTTGLNFEWFERMRANPYKILTGVIQLVSSIALAYFAIYAVVAMPQLSIPAVVIPTIIGALLS